MMGTKMYNEIPSPLQTAFNDRYDKVRKSQPWDPGMPIFDTDVHKVLVPQPYNKSFLILTRMFHELKNVWQNEVSYLIIAGWVKAETDRSRSIRKAAVAYAEELDRRQPPDLDWLDYYTYLDTNDSYKTADVWKELGITTTRQKNSPKYRNRARLLQRAINLSVPPGDVPDRLIPYLITERSDEVVREVLTCSGNLDILVGNLKALGDSVFTTERRLDAARRYNERWLENSTNASSE